MQDDKHIKMIVTLGPSTNTLRDLQIIKNKGVDFVRINMSHSSIDDLRYFIGLAKKVGIPFIIDTEGSQIRTGDLVEDFIFLEENDEIELHKKEFGGDNSAISIHPAHSIDQLKEGDLLHIDFDALVLRVTDTSALQDGYIKATAITSGSLGKNKAIAVDSATGRHFDLPVLSPKDYESVAVGLEEGIEYFAASFIRSGASVDKVREATGGKMKIISKIECVDALECLDEIIKKSDMLLLDRGDLSKEIPIEKIPFAQKIILSSARKHNKDVFIATNLLESMVKSEQPTRAEVRDVITSVLEGASGVTLSSETAIGSNPIKCINMIKKLIKQASFIDTKSKYTRADDKAAGHLKNINYLLDSNIGSSLIPPHGGRLVNRVLKEIPDKKYLDSLPKIKLSKELQMDVEQIAFGTFSPLEGFMGKADFEGVLNNMRLADGNIWTIPIILDVSQSQADEIIVGGNVVLVDDDENALAVLHVDSKYKFNKKDTVMKLYGTESVEHPGVCWVNNLKPILLGGKIALIRQRKSESRQYELTPRQVRRLFDERGWSSVVGFHTRNVIHRSHEFIQLKALESTCCDGLFIHPVIGKKKIGDFNAKYIIKSYEHMIKNFYPTNRAVLATYATFSRYGGPREALFTALCRQNYGCSHFIIGRDHTGVGSFYHPKASHDIFEKFPDLGITPVFFDQVFYSKEKNAYMHERDTFEHSEHDKFHISGSEARETFERGELPPEWFMRPEISEIIITAIKNGEEVFVKENLDS